MASIEVPRYFVTKKGAQGKPDRYYWQPSKELAGDKWPTRRLAATLEAAIEEAKAINERLDKWRAGELESAAAGPAPGSVAALIALFKTQGKWTGAIKGGAKAKQQKILSAKTKAGYVWCFEKIEEWCGDAPVASLTRRAVLAWYEAMQPDAPAKANALMRALRLLLRFAVDKGWIAVNPAAKPGMIGTAPRQTLWSEAAVALMVEEADAFGRPSIGDAILCAYNLGQREGDILRLPKARYADGRFRFKQNKTGKWVDVPATAMLRERLEARAKAAVTTSGAGATIAATTIVVSEQTARPYTENNFSHLFGEIRAAAIARQRKTVEELLGANLAPLLEEATEIADSEERLELYAANELPADVVDALELLLELDGLWYMDLRRTAVVRLGEAGCTEAQIASVSGHSIERTRQILETYLPRTTAMAEAAIEKLEAYRAKRASTKEGA